MMKGFKRKIEILNYLLANYNNGRRKTFFLYSGQLIGPS